MTTNNTQNAIDVIVYRNKFVPMVTAENSDAVDAEFRKLFTFNEREALKFLWELTYCPKVAEEFLQKMGIEAENASKLISELRYQYALRHVKFLNVELPYDAVKSAYNTLRGQAGDIAAYVVYQRCVEASYKEHHSIERAVYLLGNDKEAYFFGGLRSLRFYEEEANFLKPFHVCICELLKAVVAEKAEREPAAESPFSVLKDLSFGSDEDLPFEMSSVEPTAQEEGKTLKLDANAIRLHRDLFTTFVKGDDMNVVIELGKLGLDLNQVFAKKAEITDFLSALMDQKKAEIKAEQARRAYEFATSNLEKATEELKKAGLAIECVK